MSIMRPIPFSICSRRSGKGRKMAKDVADVPGIGRVEMKARICHTDDCCPTVYATGRDTYLVQGYTVPGDEALRTLGVPVGEGVVEVPRELLLGLLADEGEAAPTI
jgi:hypothetical protein